MKSQQKFNEDQRPTKTKTKTIDVDSLDDLFGPIQDQPLTTRPETKRDEPATNEPRTTTLPRASQRDTLRATAGIRPTDQMRDMLNRMRDIPADDEDVPYPTPPAEGELVVRTARDLPTVVGGAMQAAGFQNPEWHTVANLPGNMSRAIRSLGRALFRSFTRTPTDNITMIGNVGGQGPNSTAEVNAVMKYLRDHGTEITQGDIDFENTIPGYRADIRQYRANGARFLAVRDEFGNYIYSWPEQDSLDAQPQAQQLGREAPRLNEESETQTEWIARIKAEHPGAKFKEDKKTTRIVAYVNGLPVDEFDGQMDLFDTND